MPTGALCLPEVKMKRAINRVDLMRTSSVALLAPLLAVLIFMSGCSRSGELQSATVSATYAPDVPPPIPRSRPDTVRVGLDASLHDIALAQGVLYHAWTFNGHVPGPFIRARVEDVLEVRITNSDPSGMAHNVDFHAVTGPGGGGDITNVTPGQQRVGHFKLLHPGLFVYHCAANPMSAHIANGMYGLILVEPEKGMPRVDHEYYIMQSEFYTTPPTKDSAFVEYSPVDGLREDPRYVLFNGDYTSLVGANALKVRTGESVRIYFGNVGPNKSSSFHIVGAVFDNVYREGDLVDPPERWVSVTLVPAGGATVVEIRPEVPGTYTLLDHSIFRTEKGAIGQMLVSGQPRPDIYSGG